MSLHAGPRINSRLEKELEVGLKQRKASATVGSLQLKKNYKTPIFKIRKKLSVISSKIRHYFVILIIAK